MAKGSTLRALKRKQRERVLRRKMFYASLGECITAWVVIERHIFDLFDRALFGSKSDKKSQLYYSGRSQRLGCDSATHLC